MVRPFFGAGSGQLRGGQPKNNHPQRTPADYDFLFSSTVRWVVPCCLLPPDLFRSLRYTACDVFDEVSHGVGNFQIDGQDQWPTPVTDLRMALLAAPLLRNALRTCHDDATGTRRAALQPSVSAPTPQSQHRTLSGMPWATSHGTGRVAVASFCTRGGRQD